MDMAAMALKAIDSRRCGDETGFEYWSLRIQHESDREQREQTLREWDALKGSPEHG